MFSKVMLRKSCNCKPGKLVICLAFLNILVLLSILGMCHLLLPHWIFKHEPVLRELWRFERKRADITEVLHNGQHPNRDHLQDLHGNNMTEDEPLTASSKVTSQQNIKVLPLKMDGCPVDWPHEVVRNDSAGMPAAQVCRRIAGSRVGQWKCATGWRRLRGDPYCIKNSATSAIDTYVSFVKGKLALPEVRILQFVAENLKLLFYQLPGTSVEVSSSVFRAVSENENFDQSLRDHFHKFTFIMHPCSRLINIWEEIFLNSRVNVSFTSFLKGLLPPWKPSLLSDEMRIKTQTELLLRNAEHFWLDQILVLESWNESLAELQNKTNLGTKSFHILKEMPSNSKKCSRMYTQETWLKMTNYFAMDFCVLRYSTSINETHIIRPPLDLTVKALTSRYNFCRQNTTNLHTSSPLTSSQPFLVSPNLCTIHTYYQPAFDKPKYIIANQNVLSVWKKAWVAAGWRIRVVNETNAMLHPDYKELKEKFQSLPTINSKRYELGNFLRHVAMAAVGGGWMSDYDTLPLNFPPCSKIPFNGSYTVWSGFVPALVSANGTDYTRVAHLMAEVGLQWRARPNFFLKSGWREQVSDMRTLSVLVSEGDVKSFQVIIETSDLSPGGFACNKSKRLLKTHNSGNLPEGMSSLPWGVHLSHAFMGFVKSRNITLWPGLSWERDNGSPSFRQTFMKYVYNIYLHTCNLL